ncbi:MAG: autotransporter assembly complex protein TamA [Gammaproteobacteria bacterium]|nr:autotransporter assembly complex protein TamA [Gammaproteobacteria bacterium]
MLFFHKIINLNYIKQLLIIIISFFLCLIFYTNIHAKTPSTQLKVEIIITGIDGELKKNALDYIELKKSLNDPHFSEVWLKKLHKKADKNISDALQPFGYYQVKVNSKLEKKSTNNWQATYSVTPGALVRIIDPEIIIEGPGKNDPNVISLIANFPIKHGDSLHHNNYDTAKEKLISDIGRLGYTQIKTQQSKVIVNPQKNTAKLNINLLSGEKYSLGHFYFHQDFLHEEFIRSYIKDIKKGEPLSQENLLELQNALLNSAYFSSVNIKPDFSREENNQVPIDITLKPAKRHKFSLGAGYDTEIEANVSFRWQHRRLNKYGHNSDVMTKLSSKKSVLQGAYWIPVGDPSKDKIGIISKFETEDTDNTDRDTFDLETGYWFNWKNWSTSLFTEYKYEEFTSGDEPEINTELLSLGARIEQTHFEKALFPRKGWALFAEIRGANAGLLSDIDYTRLYLKSRLLLPIIDNGRLILRTEFGFAETSDFDQYPSSLRFYAGGDQSVRGYKWKALGPKDKEDNVIGGRNVLTGSIEYNHQVSEKWVIAGFLDAGNAYNDELDKVYSGAGFGARWIAPFGLVRTDLGFPLQSDDDISDDNVVLYFGFEVTL